MHIYNIIRFNTIKKAARHGGDGAFKAAKMHITAHADIPAFNFLTRRECTVVGEVDFVFIGNGCGDWYHETTLFRPSDFIAHQLQSYYEKHDV